ncbi:response regulator transcription factor [Microbacterium sp. BH-3-3-3]|uniref:response regulator n=1 Tax=Microbacterium sp. BH-3-3-3 TaxID=1906742 RepID=UPI0008928E92|nr:response regulator transcription factor [Microbacterium sp. BH-3-3-3]AOX46457.1 DNA-binding response regulator [Microbacterium sp. BH-3-3-3]
MSESSDITVLVVDDQPLAREGNSLVLDSAPGIRVIGEAADGNEAMQRAAELKPDIVLMDVRMPGMDGIQATRGILDRGLRSRVIVLTTFDLDEYAFGALRAGASAFLVKTATHQALVDAVRVVARGDAIVTPRITRQLIDAYTGRDQPASAGEALSALSPRERDVFDAIALGLSNGEISAMLHLSPTTVKTHINRIFAKLDLRDRVQAIILAHQLGLPIGGAAM